MSTHQTGDRSQIDPLKQQSLVLPAIQIRTSTTLHDLTQGEDRTLSWYGAKLLRMDCFPALQTLAHVEECIIADTDSLPAAVAAQAMSSLQAIGKWIARREYDDASCALNAFAEKAIALPDGSTGRALLELLRAQVGALARDFPLSSAVELSTHAEVLLKQATSTSQSVAIFQAQALSASQSISLDHLDHATKIERFSRAVATFHALPDQEKQSVLSQLNDLTVSLLGYFPVSLRAQRQQILHQIHNASGSEELYRSAPAEHRFQLDLNLLLMASYSPQFHLTLSGNDPELHSRVEALAKQVLESCCHELGKPTSSHQPLFIDIQRVAKLCRDHECFELAYTIADALYHRMDLNRLQHRDILLYAASVRLTSRPHIQEAAEKLPSTKELKDLTRRDFARDRDAIDQLELLYGELLLLADPGTYDRQHIQLQRIVTEDIIARKGVKDSVRLRAVQLLEELYEYQ
jgi:hypothetical protein